jgi:hypothetical protein
MAAGKDAMHKMGIRKDKARLFLRMVGISSVGVVMEFSIAFRM